MLTKVHRRASEGLSDDQVVRLVREGQTELFEIIMRRYNRRLFRVALSILKDAFEAEDVVQEAYVRAFEKLHQFEGRALLSTWLTKIAVHEALNRRRRGRVVERDTMFDEVQDANHPDSARTPEHSIFVRELREGLEKAVLAMPEDYRTVFMMRQVEAMSTAETASLLDLSQAAVKTRLHRAKQWLRKELTSKFVVPATEAFPFADERCDRVVEGVLRRICRLKIER